MQCGREEWAALPEKWKRMAEEEVTWPAMQEMECSVCKRNGAAAIASWQGTTLASAKKPTSPGRSSTRTTSPSITPCC